MHLEEPAECASLAHILATRNHRPMLRLQALQIVEGICRSLDHSHRNGCTHGDVQPEKIFITAEGHVRLTGHGSTAQPAYASCEVLEGAPPVPADDLFSTACTGYQLLAGQPPFAAGNALLAEAAAQRPSRILHLSPGQWRALDRALAFRRVERQPDIASFLNELRNQYTGTPESDGAAAAQSPASASAQTQRDPRLPVMAGIVAAVTLIALGWWLLRTPEAAIDAAPDAAATTEPETGFIMREAAPAADTAITSPPPLATLTPAAPATPQPLAVLPIPQRQVDPAPSVASAEAEPAASMPIRPTTALIAPRPVAPALPVPVAPSLALETAPTAETGIYMVPFSSLKVRRYADPDYPRTRDGQRVAGWVDVSFGVDEVGRTTDLQVTAAEPAGQFEAAALAAVRRWRFAPVEAPAGSDAEVRSEIRVRFIPD
jgi:TonB family protein